MQAKGENDDNPRKDNYVASGAGRSLWILGQLMTFKLYGESETVGLFEMVIPPGGGAPPHLHRTQDETHYILEGEFEFQCGERKITAGPGSVVYVPKGLVHAFGNHGTQPGRLLFVETPAGPLEQWLAEIGDPVTDPSSPPQGAPDMEKLAAAAQRTGGIEFVEQAGY
jgi:mannose-6-phosphate isomerase-like protein (cupin superfamily)